MTLDAHSERDLVTYLREHRGQRSTSGPILDLAALFWLVRDAKGHDVLRKNTRPKAPVYNSFGRVIAYEDGVTAEITSEDPSLYGKRDEDGFEPGRGGDASRVLFAMRSAGLDHELKLLLIAYGEPGEVFAGRALETPMPRHYALAPVTAEGMAFWEAAEALNAAPRWRGRAWLRLSKLEREQVQREDPVLAARMLKRQDDIVSELPPVQRLRSHIECVLADRVAYEHLREPWAAAEQAALGLFEVACAAWRRAAV